MKIAILSIPGSCRSGRSFLSNTLIDALIYYGDKGSLDDFDETMLHFDRNESNGFKYAPGYSNCTEGIYIYQPLIIPNPENKSEKVAVLLIDSQGFGNLDVENSNDIKIFTILNNLSSHMIYNSVSKIKLDEILGLVMTSNIVSEMDESKRPTLEILIRDYSFKSGNIDKQREEINDYVTKDLNIEDNVICVYIILFYRTNIKKYNHIIKQIVFYYLIQADVLNIKIIQEIRKKLENNLLHYYLNLLLILSKN